MENYAVQVPSATIQFGEKKYLMCFDLYGFLQLESLGDSIESILAEFEQKPISRLLDVIYAFAQENHPDISKAELAKGVPLTHMRDAGQVIMKILPEAMAQMQDQMDGKDGAITNAADPIVAGKLKEQGKK